MNESLKRGLLIAVIAVAVVAVGYQVYNMAVGETLQEGVNNAYSGPSMKQMEMENMKAAKGGAAPPQRGEVDLGGAPPGR